MEVKERIEILRNEMTAEGIDWYLMTSDDFHSSEYVSDYFKVREYYTGFTGDNAYLILSKEKAFMWTDGRFFIQAEIELAGSSIELMRMGEENVPTLSEFIKDNVTKGQTLSFDGRTVASGLGEKLGGILEQNGAKLKYEGDLAGSLWDERPSLPIEPIWVLSDEMSGESISSKIDRVRAEMAKEGADCFLLAKLDDIAWLTNMRGNDIECNPVFLSYLFLTEKECFLFLRDEAVTDNVRNYLKESNVILKKYEEFFDFIGDFKADKAIMLDKSGVSFLALKLAAKNSEVKTVSNPTTLMKAIKNSVELERLKEATIMDSVAVTKFMYWLKNEADLNSTSELDCAAKIDGLRKELPGYIELSFPTIAGYGANAAMMHYEAKENNFAYLKPEGMLLVDSGGQYEKGTTDVTRTFVLGPVSEEIKLHFSKVAAGMLAVADTKFLYGCTGRNLDIMAREPLWEIGIDYKCGTGHGVGYILNVHEGPHSLRWKYVKGAEEAVFEEGMIVSDEPGVYIEGSHGIRTENVILCTKKEKNGDGQFMGFEHLTFVPIDLDGINPEYLEPKDIKRLNKYHADVYEKISPYLDVKEAEWLKEATRAI